MTLDQQVASAGVALTAFMGWTGLVGWVWQIRGIAVNARDDLHELKEERERDKVSWGARLQRAEETAASVNRLADAIESGARLTALQISNLSERFAEHATFTKEQLAEIRHDQKNLRMALNDKVRMPRRDS